MAINQNTTDSSSFQAAGSSGANDSVASLWKLLDHILKNVNNDNANIPYQTICDWIVVLFAGDQPIKACEIKSARKLAEQIMKQFQELIERKPYRDLVKDCLEKLYDGDALTVKKLPSPYTTIMLALMDPKQGVAWLLSKNMTDEHIRKILSVFMEWLCTMNFAPNLNEWVVQMVEGLVAMGKSDCVFGVCKEKLNHYKDLSRFSYYQKQLGPVIRCLEPYGNAMQSESGRLRHVYSESYESALNSDASLMRPNNARVGLVNLGNTCYMNSVVQALAMTKQFCTEILLKQIDAPPFSEVQQLLALLIHSRRPELTPRAVLASTRPPGFAPGYQQDSSEFLSYLLDRLHEQEKKLLHGGGNVASGTVDAGTKTLVQKTFEGRLSVGCRCTVCNSTNHTIEAFRSLDLAFPDDSSLTATGDGTHSVQKLLDFYCSSEKLVGENQYFCDRCHQLRDCDRSVTVTVPPQNLILTIKHFRYDQNRQLRAKLMNKILHNENISLVITDGNGHRRQLHYRNYAVVVHCGTSMDAGHYYTYAQDGAGTWCKFNDNYVTECSTSEMQNIPNPNTPYILFYQLVVDNGNSSQPQTSAAGDTGLDAGSGVYENFPALDELPVRLQEFVRDDNLSYHREEQEQRNKKASKMPLLLLGNGGNNRRQSDDYDDQPPSSCGSNWMPSSNKFIY
ncbi:ubiquitin carboxyl-terminal hydrolase 35 [Anopheles cruzii]|uniref:ubiquitin carboxyl-terminal hydrolase 35 n=1 Tax=Anopheles cruzii TaxID=68878 RepID=UPI0022EC8EE5|nr:ubiquitin carboxyl-terminal hydrolase 35 [Anopheles cruzii]